MISFIIIIVLLLFILCIVCDIKSILNGENKRNQKNKNNNLSNNIVPLTIQAQIDKELEIQERTNWRPNRQLFVTKEMKEQIFK